MTVTQQCHWCGTTNTLAAIGVTWCKNPACRHRADLPRSACTCPKCAAAQKTTAPKGKAK